MSRPVRRGAKPALAALSRGDEVYLFGDSARAPGSGNLLDTLERLVTAAARCGALEREVELRLDGLEHLSLAGVARLEAIEALLGSAAAAVDSTASRSRHRPAVEPFAAAMRSRATELLVEARAARAREVEEEKALARTHISRLREEVRSVLERFFIEAWMPEKALRVVGQLGPRGYRLVSSHGYPGRLAAGFSLDLEPSPLWRAPCRVGSILPGIELRLGSRPSFFRRRPRPRLLPLDDYLVTRFEVDARHGWIGLRRRREAETDDLFLEVAKERGGTWATVTLLASARGRDKGSREADPVDLPAIAALHGALLDSTMAPVRRRRRLLSVTVDDVDVLTLPSVMPLIRRVVDVLAPQLREIAARSSSRAELVLKVPRGQGFREEIFLRKRDLEAALDEAPPKVRAMFEGLGVLPERRSGTHRVAGAPSDEPLLHIG